MPHDVAFMPWISIREPKTIGDLRLLPYVRGRLPGDQGNIRQADLDAMTRAYANHGGRIIRKCTLVERGQFRTGMDSDSYRASLFEAQRLLGFSALAHRLLFSGLRYTNYHTYTLIVQRYEPGRADRFVFRTRRRDGSAQHYWAADHFAFQRPLHVDEHAAVDLDEPLLGTLLTLDANSQHILDAITDFNGANTDSEDVDPQAEIVMIKSAFESLFNIKQNAIELVGGINRTLADINKEVPTAGPMKALWESHWQKARSYLEAWARDFCLSRNTAAHGGQRTITVWARKAHLAFAALFFPLLVKKMLSDAGQLQLQCVDVEFLRRIETLLMYDPFTENIDKHPWTEVRDEAIGACMHQAIADIVERVSRYDSTDDGDV